MNFIKFFLTVCMFAATINFFAGDNIIKNGGFEAGGQAKQGISAILAGWRIRDLVPLAHSIDSTMPHSGARCGKIMFKVSEIGKTGYFAPHPNPIVKKGKYLLGGFVKFTSLSEKSSALVKITAFTVEGKFAGMEKIKSKKFATSPQYVAFELPYEVKNDALSLAITFNLDGPGEMLIDDIYFKKIDESK